MTEHQLLKIPICMLHGDNRKGTYPADIKATVQYGENLQALSVALNTIGAVSVKRTHEILSGLGHFDETGTRVAKKLWWVHDASNCEFTYLDISPKRGYLGMEQCGVLPLFSGIAMHDCWASAFIDLLMEMKKVKDKAIEVGKESLSYYHYHKFDKRYNELIKQGKEYNPLPFTTVKKRGRKKKGKILALMERLELCYFFLNERQFI